MPICVCGSEQPNPGILPTGVLPDERLAERAREKAFRTAGLVRNRGKQALLWSIAGLVFFPAGLLGAGLALDLMLRLEKTRARYSGRVWALPALLLGITTSLLNASFLRHWLL